MSNWAIAPSFICFPKRGFNPLKKSKIAKLNLEQIQSFIDKKKIDISSKINLEVLKDKKIVNKSFKKIKILGNGNIKSKIDIEVDLSSISAKEKIEKIGGILKIKSPK